MTAQRNTTQTTERDYLVATGIQPFDGDHRAADGATGKPDDALVDAPEPTLADLEQAAEVVGGGVELP
jgi:hypothetical protein